MSPRCDVSVVISTYNRSGDLPIALDAVLNQQGDASYEVIVVDNNSTDGTAAVVQARITRGARRLRYVFEPRQGLPFGRNAGILAARAPLVAFTDDDVHVDARWVETVKRTFDAHPGVDAIGGRILPSWPGAIPVWLGDGPYSPLALQDRGATPFAVNAANAAACLIGANFAFRRSVFDRIGLFSTAYLRNEDRELQLRLWEAGGQGLYCPDLIVRVDVPEDRITKAYYRFWFTATGRFHSRMRLLERLDRDGGLIDPSRHRRRFLGVPLFLYRQLATETAQCLGCRLVWREHESFAHEVRARYLASYIEERLGERGTLRVAAPPPLAQRSGSAGGGPNQPVWGPLEGRDRPVTEAVPMSETGE
jgi:glycosyltransferase involved in cell wall biosynthesis